MTFFFYGTLTSTGDAHGLVDRFRGATEPARVPGRLIETGEGDPMLVVPASAILAKGSNHADGDAAKCAKYEPVPRGPVADEHWVEGEWVELTEPAEALPFLDLYEDFTPGQESEYQRVLLSVECDGKWRVAWAYVAP